MTVNDIALKISVALHGFAVLLYAIGSGSGYWYQAGGEDRKFSNIGLWKVCFNGFEYWSDYVGKAYFGCWWIFHKEYWYIHEWLLPPWFVASQAMAVLACIFMFIATALYLAQLLQCINAESETRQLNALAGVQVLTSLFAFLSVLIFGVMSNEDRTWMPLPEHNHYGWSFGLCVLAGFFFVFATISLFIYIAMVKYEKEQQEKGPLMMPPPPKV